MSDKIKKNFWVSKEMSDRWDEFCAARGWSLTMLIKEAVHAFITNAARDTSATPAILQQIADVASKKEALKAERDLVDAELKARMDRIESMLANMTANVVPTEDERARVILLISKGWFSLKELTGALNMPVERVGAITRQLKEMGLATQNDKLQWHTIKSTGEVEAEE
ncbi:MAG: hypothetical protein Q6373_004535 [Candidatus Sigynarchaeota archaeon]